MHALFITLAGIGGLILFQRSRRGTAELPPEFTAEEFREFPIPESDTTVIGRVRGPEFDLQAGIEESIAAVEEQQARAFEPSPEELERIGFFSQPTTLE